jgi:signal transduction histidine kinase/CheY-like chemotaxis protein
MQDIKSRWESQAEAEVFEMMYVANVIQVCGIVAGMLMIVDMIRKDRNRAPGLLMLGFVCTVADLAGYSIRMNAATYDGVITGLRIEYFGKCYVITFILVFYMEYLYIKMKESVVYIMLAIDSVFLAVVVLLPYHSLFFKDLQMTVSDSGICRISYTCGILFALFVIYQIIKLLAVAYLFVRIGYSVHGAHRSSALLFIASFLIAFLGMIADCFQLLQPYEIFHAALLIACLVLAIGAYRPGMTDIVQHALAKIVNDQVEGTIIIDNLNRVVYENSKIHDRFNKIHGLLNEDGTINIPMILISSGEIFEIDGNFYEMRVSDIEENGYVKGKMIGLIDVTDIYKRTAFIMELVEKAENDAKKKEQMLANMSHEMRTPLNAIYGLTNLLANGMHTATEENYLRTIKVSTENLISIINDTLDMSKVQAGKMELRLVEYHLEEMIEQIQAVLMIQAESKGLLFIVDDFQDVPQYLLGDDIRIQQILINLCNNAIKYTRQGSVHLSIKWKEGINGKGTLIFNVVDTGIGIREENIDKLFTAYEQFDGEKNRYIEGTGLGLMITKQLVELMEGTISVKSTYGVGSDFEVQIEQQRVWHAAEGSRKEEEKHLYAPDAQVIVVDDNDVNLMVAEAILALHKIKPISLKSGYELKEYIHRHADAEIDVIFLDHMMPDMDGIETAKQVRKMEHSIARTVPIIAMTGNSISDFEEEYVQAGISDYLEKPIREEKLEKILRKWLPKSRIVEEEPQEEEEPKPEESAGETKAEASAQAEDQIEEEIPQTCSSEQMRSRIEEIRENAKKVLEENE